MISQQQIKNIAAKIKEITAPKAVYLFGSYATGTFTENSDLDLAIIKSKITNKHQELLQIRKALFDMWIPMDLLIMNEKEYTDKKVIYGTIQYEIANKGQQL